MLRYTDYGALPAFANATNRALDKQVRAKESHLVRLTADLEDQAQRSDALRRHLHHVQQQLTHVQSLNDARGREIETEDHLKSVAEREVGRLGADMKRMAKELEAVQEQGGVAQNTIFRTSEKINKLRAQLKQEERELEDWLKVQQEKEEDNVILSKYAKEDEGKSRELALVIEKLVGEVGEKRAELNQALTETQVSQMEVERIAIEFRQLHQERQELLSQWEAAISTMRKRDQQIEQAQERYEGLKTEEVEKQDKINQRQRQLDDKLEQKAEIEKNIQTLDRHVAKLKGDQVEATQALIAYQDELEAHRTHLNRTANDVQSKRAEVQRLQDDVASKTQQQSAEEKRYAGLQAKLKQVMEKTGTKEEKAAELAEYLRQDEVRNKELDKQIKALKDLTFKHNQDLFKLRQDEKTLHAEISGGRAAIRNLTSKIAKLDQESIAQRSLIYNQEYTLQQLERKVKRAQGDRSDEEQAALNAKISRLSAQYDKAVEHHTLLSAQLKKAQDDYRHAKRRVAVLEREMAGVTDQIDELNLYITSATAQLAAKVKDKEEVMVEAAVLKLEVKKLRGFMHARADEVLALESRQVQLQLALQERTHEIHLHKQMLKAQIRAAEEERYAAAAELRERQHQVELMKTRYEILMAQISGTGGGLDGDGGDEAMGGAGDGAGEKSQAYYIIRAAQQRENLQRQGDEMDAKIQAAEREIKAMENTLRLLNSKNDKFKSHLGAADVNPQDLEHKAYLQAQLDSALATLKHKQNVLLTLQHELADAEQQLAAISAEEAREHTVVAQLVAQRAALDKQVDEAAAKKKRAEQVVLRLVKEIKAARGQSKADVLDEEVDLAAREFRDAANYALHKASEVLDRHLASYVHGTAARGHDPAAGAGGGGQVLGGAGGPAPRAMQRFQELMQELGIQPPSRPLTRVSSRAGQQSPLAVLLSGGGRQPAGSRAPSRLAPSPSLNNKVGGGASGGAASPVTLSMAMPSVGGPGATSGGAGRMSPKVPAAVAVRRPSLSKSGASSPVQPGGALSPTTLPVLPVGIGGHKVVGSRSLSRAPSSVGGGSAGSSRASSRAGSRASMGVSGQGGGLAR